MEMFDEMIDNIRTDTVFFLLKMELRKNEPQQPKKYNTPNKVEIIEDKKTIKTSGLPGRNDPCPCGSGKKYKNCCGK